jgi:ubiquinol-cytochrome c reductase cytochrome b subunit
MKPFLGWLDQRTGYRDLAREALFENIPGGSRWRYVWGSTLVFTFAVQIITGLALWLCYSPSTQTAWESVFYIQNNVPGGWFVRGLHHYTAQAMNILLALHLMQVVIDGAYKAPREVNFWFGVALLVLVLALSLTGYLLPWDQKGFWATKVATNIVAISPLAGPFLQRILIGGTDYGHQTLTRFFALHAGVLPGLTFTFSAVTASPPKCRGAGRTRRSGRTRC